MPIGARGVSAVAATQHRRDPRPAGGGPVDVTSPAVPTGLAAEASSQRVIYTWTANAEADLLRYRYQTFTQTNTPETPQTPTEAEWGDPTPTLAVSVDRNGLVNGNRYWFRVQAVDTSSNASAWSAAVSGRPSGAAVAERLSSGVNRRLSWAFRKGGNTGNSVTDHTRYAAVPKANYDGNGDKNLTAPPRLLLKNGITGTTGGEQGAVDIWDGRASTFGAHIPTAVGPMAMINLPITFHPDVDSSKRSTVAHGNKPIGSTYESFTYVNNNGATVTAPTTQNLQSVWAMAKTATGGWDTDFEAMAQNVINLNTNPAGGYDGITNWEKRIYIRLAHEHNGTWYPWYSGWDTGISDYFATLGGTYDSATGTATPGSAKQTFINKFYGLDASILTPLLINGNRGPLFAAAWRAVVDAFRGIDDDFIFDWNVSHPAANPGADDDLSKDFNPKAWPGDDYVDVITCDLYGRGSGAITTRGMTDSVLVSIQQIVALGAGSMPASQNWSRSRNIPIGFGEVGVAVPRYQLWEPNTTYTIPRDAQGRATLKIYLKETHGSANRYEVINDFTSGATFAVTAQMQLANATMAGTDLECSRWWTQWCELLDSQAVMNRSVTPAVELLNARAIEGRAANGNLLGERTIGGVLYPPIASGVRLAYWMSWFPAPDNGNNRKLNYQFKVEKEKHPLTFAALQAKFNVGPYAPPA